MTMNKHIVAATIFIVYCAIVITIACLHEKPINETPIGVAQPSEQPLGLGEGTEFRICDDSTDACKVNISDKGNVAIANNITTIHCLKFDNGGKVGNCG